MQFHSLREFANFDNKTYDVQYLLTMIVLLSNEEGDLGCCLWLVHTFTACS